LQRKRGKRDINIIVSKGNEISDLNFKACSCKSIEELEQLIQKTQTTMRHIPHSAEFDKTQKLMNKEILKENRDILKQHAEKITALLVESTEAYRLSIGHGKTSVGCAIKAGEVMIAAKKLVGHGNWGKWIQDNCNISQDTASRYMKLAEADPELLKDATSLKEAYLACGVTKPVKKTKTPATGKTGPQKPEGIDYLKNGFNSQRFTLPDTASFLNDFKEMLEDIELLKPLVNYYTIKTTAVELHPVEIQKAVAVEVKKPANAKPAKPLKTVGKPLFSFQPRTHGMDLMTA
jgi:hypothetical protein